MPKPANDPTADARHRRAAEVDRRMAASPVTGTARAADRRRIEAEVDAEEIAQAATAATQAEAAAERARIAAVVKLGRDRDRGQQALRAALLAPIGATAAAGLLAGAPRDDQAAPEALAVPGFTAFGTAAAQQERRRIGSAFARPEAAGRFGSVCALVLDGDGSLTGEQIAPLLATLPTDADKPRMPSLAERAQGAAEFGGDASPRQTKGDAAAEGWKRAVAKVNAGLGAGAVGEAGMAAATDPLAGLPGADDPSFGTKAEADQIMAAARARLGA